ncbi:Histidine phosphatase superfamily, clade-1 [Plasmopara halstedii]|uniref:Histidine phosphatase superfamily, clade-1 n=1 Tax=Plasmopara halstedii TaxID=4781 RepID=A0A0P1ARR4_PLAHL|nr:Histidine phosphatase superfamily, clade-1 [Plasmopara halstedii]CEG43599.1 Histidine phosphatase superfamily, clade-1 [Plasmopara halstedii]|eukprot:XP_024579968.1 Histidine phosphatase superfamily, clade-1 [Plasmopara halstedii]
MSRGVRHCLLSFGVWPALLNAAENVIWKLQLFSVALLHLFFSSDKRWLQTTPETTINDSKAFFTTVLVEPQSAVVIKIKRILFIRHAESEWNVVFNRGFNLKAISNLLHAVVREWLLLPTSDSVFLDSPLSSCGHLQAQSLHDRVCEALQCSVDVNGHTTSEPLASSRVDCHSLHQTEKASLLRYLGCPVPESVIVTSNLRRSIDTARIVSASRLLAPGERIHVLSCLQEIGRNFDTLAISPPHAILPPEVMVKGLHGEKCHDELFNVTESYGNKTILSSGRDRLIAFAQWVFLQQTDVVVVYGHSLWFRAFCRELLPQDIHHEAKSDKFSNCGVVTFLLEEHSGEMKQYKISPESFKNLV